MHSKNALKGFFKPKHPEKYKGDPTNIVYRSSYELKLMTWLDDKENILKWSSEELAIPYRSPVDNNIHRYFPDAIVQLKDREGKIKTVMIEVKPEVWTRAPVPRDPPHTKTYIKEVFNYGVNTSKWNAARDYCKHKGWEFMIFTEKQLGINTNVWGKNKQ